MKKLLLCGLCAVMLFSLTPACGQAKEPRPSEPAHGTEQTSPSAGVYDNGELTYSNLVGSQVQDEVKAVMLAAGIDQSAAEKFFVWVNDFNQAMKDCESYELQDGFVTIQEPVVDYGEYGPMSRMWFKENQREYGDVLCRIAAFQLMKHNIEAGEVIDSQNWECYTDTQWLCSDWEAISSFPLVDFSKEEAERYFTLYNPIAVEGDLSSEEMFQAVTEEWTERQISFADSGVSLITIWIQYEDRIAAAHAAALIEDNDTLWLVEKTNPQSPYQAAKFSGMDQVRQYMYESIHIEDVRYGGETGAYIVLRNENWLK